MTRQSAQLENTSNRIVREMAVALGKPEGIELVDRYTKGCAGVGLCNLGCGLDLKGNMVDSFLPIGLASGRLTVLTECEALSLDGERARGRYRARSLGVVLRDFSSGRVVRRLRVRARSFVIAAGAFFSSAVLLRSHDLPGRGRIGTKVFLQPHAQIFALFDRPVTRPGVMENGRYLPCNGVPALYNFTGFLEKERFFWLASILLPANFASFVSNLPADEHLALMRRFRVGRSRRR